MYDSTFEKSFLFVLKWEGGYVNDPNDPGGETKYGISKRAYPTLDIKNLTIEQAKNIYFKDYWIRNRCDKIAELSPKLAFVLFYASVNLGHKRAAKLLQKAINRQKKSILVVDGIVGSKTLETLSSCDVEMCFETYCMLHISYYIKLVQKHKSLKRYLFGWLNRTIDAYEYALENF